MKLAEVAWQKKCRNNRMSECIKNFQMTSIMILIILPISYCILILRTLYFLNPKTARFVVWWNFAWICYFNSSSQELTFYWLLDPKSDRPMCINTPPEKVCIKKQNKNWDQCLQLLFIYTWKSVYQKKEKLGSMLTIAFHLHLRVY